MTTQTIENTNTNVADAYLSGKADSIKVEVQAGKHGKLIIGRILHVVRDSGELAEMELTLEGFVKAYLQGTLTKGETTELVQYAKYTDGLTEMGQAMAVTFAPSVYRGVPDGTDVADVADAVANILADDLAVTQARLREVFAPTDDPESDGAASGDPEVTDDPEAIEMTPNQEWNAYRNSMLAMIRNGYTPTSAQVRKIEELLATITE